VYQNVIPKMDETSNTKKDVEQSRDQCCSKKRSYTKEKFNKKRTHTVYKRMANFPATLSFM
jgi:hypothetical protein